MPVVVITMSIVVLTDHVCTFAECVSDWTSCLSSMPASVLTGRVLHCSDFV